MEKEEDSINKDQRDEIRIPYTDVKKNKIVSFAGTWMQLEAIILSKLMLE